MHYHVPAQYAPFVADVLKRAIEEAQHDAEYRRDCDPRIQRWAPVPDALIDRTAAAGTSIAVLLLPTEI